MIKRTSRLSLKYANSGKIEKIRKFIDQYIVLVNFYIEQLWNDKIFIGSYISKDIQSRASTDLTARIQQCAGKQALEIVKSQRKKKNKVMPVFSNRVVNLDQRFVDLYTDNNTSFDIIMKLASLGKAYNCVFPLKKHKHFNKYNNSWTLCKSIRLKDSNKYPIIEIIFETEVEPILTNKVIGLDIGIKKLIVDSDGNEYGKDIERLIDKIQRKQQGSKAFKKALIERDHYINKIVKELPKDTNIVMEDIKDINKNTKKHKKLRKEFRSKSQRWTYSKLLNRISLLAEVVGVQCLLVNPAYTSRTCNQCGYNHKSNRNGEIFKCKNCDYTADADYNASLNILNLGLTQQSIVAGNT